MTKLEQQYFIPIYYKSEAIAVVIFSEIDFGYVDKKVVVYHEPSLKACFEAVEAFLSERYVSIGTMTENLTQVLTRHLDSKDLIITKPLLIGSKMKNKTMRDKQLLGEKHKHFERRSFNVRHDDLRYLRKRP